MHALLFAAALAVAPTLSGRVADTTGAPLAQVRVTILEANRSTTTDLEGHYTLPGVPTGTYGVSFALVGYAPVVRRVTIGSEDLSLDVTLRPTLVELPDLQVTASPLATTSLTSPQPTSILSGDEIQANRSANLGETISSLPGVRSFSTGSGIGKPVIRGLSSNRVLVLADGQRLETQQWGDEHGPQVEAGEAERIEVIRGPASVLYGSDAIGGVVNVITKPLPDAIGRAPYVGGDLVAAYSTNNDQPDGTLGLEGASGGFGFRGAFTGRTSSDVRTPVGELPNSGGRTLNGSGSVGYRGGWGTVGASYAHRDERVEIHEDPAEDPAATPFQRIGEDRVHLTSNLAAGASHVDIDLGYERNRRREFEAEDATDVALGLLSRTYSGDVRLHHAPLGRLGGIVGASWSRNTFDEVRRGDAHSRQHLQRRRGLRLRAGRARPVEPVGWAPGTITGGSTWRTTPSWARSAQRRTYNSVTGNLGVLYRVAEPVALVLNVGRGFRAPTAFDLFSNGVHEGTVRFERGDSTLRNETSINTDRVGAGPDRGT